MNLFRDCSNKNSYCISPLGKLQKKVQDNFKKELKDGSYRETLHLIVAAQ